MIRASGAFVLCLVSAARVFAFDVTACGQTVPAGERGVLLGDLSCNAGDGPAAVQITSGFLDLQGHTLIVSDDIVGVSCTGRCWVGYGTVSGGRIGLEIDARAMAVGLRLTGPPGAAATSGIRGRVPFSPRGKLTLVNVIIEDHEVAISDVGSILGSTVGVSGCGDTTPDSECVVAFNKIKLFGLQILDSLAGFTVRALFGSIKLKESRITDGPGYGVRSARGMRLQNTTVTGNVVDLSTPRRPRLINSTCLKSEGSPVGDWDVCMND